MKKQGAILIGTAALSAAAVFGLTKFCYTVQKNTVDANAMVEIGQDTTVQLTGKADVDEVKEYDPSVYATPDESAEPTKYDIYYKCLNTLETLDQLSGTVRIYEPGIFEGVTVGNFEFDFAADQYHAVVEDQSDAGPVVLQSGNGELSRGLDMDDAVVQTRTEYFNHAGHCYDLHDYMNKKTNDYSKTLGGPTMEGIVWSDRANIYNTYGKDPTYAHELGCCFIPQEMSIGYLKNFDNWEVAEVMDWNGRKCWHIKGTAEPEYGSRFNVDTFQIWVDQETGIWYQYEGYSADGELANCFYTENIQFGDAAQEVKAFSEKMLEGYTLHSAY